MERSVGTGGEATVFRARSSSGEVVAVKLLASDHDGQRTHLAQRWSEQVRLRRAASWPAVVDLRECFEGFLFHRRGETGGPVGLFLVMDWVEGDSLETVVRRGLRTPGQVNRILEDLMPVAIALDHLHAAVAAVHGDVKPANVIMTEANGGVLVDLGMLCRLAGERAEAAGGTRGYVAPEVLRTGKLSPEADRFAFAGVVHFVLTGRHPPHPFDEERVRDNAARVPALREQPEVVGRLLEGLAQDPGARPRSLSAWLPNLTLRSPPPPRLRFRRAVIVALVVLAVVGLVVLGPPWGGSRSAKAPSDPCANVRIRSPLTNEIVPAGPVRVVWDPTTCGPLVFQWYQRDQPQPGADVKDARSGEAFPIPGPARPEERTVRTELKIWVPGASTPAHSVWIFVGSPAAEQGAMAP